MAANPGRGAKNQVRIRGPKPDQIVGCDSLAHLESLLGGQVEESRSAAQSDVIYTEFIFGHPVRLRVDNLPEEWRTSLGVSAPGPIDVSVQAAVSTLTDAKIKLRRQRAVARQILQSISDVDGFKYFEKEAWDTKHNDGYRFKFLCRDSFQNKDRAQNKVRGSNASDLNGTGYAGDDPSLAKDEKDLTLGRLPTYDCKGSIFVKFSASQSILDVVYQHMPVHREQNLVPMKRSREEGLEADDSSMAIDIDPAPAQPPPPPQQQYAPRFSLAAPPAAAPDTDDQTSTSRTKRRKRSSQKQTYKDVSSSDLPSESSNGLSTPEAASAPSPAAQPPSREPHARKDWPSSPPRSPDHPLFGDDRALLGPSVVTRVPGLAAALRHASARSSLGRPASSDADDNSAAASSSAAGGAPRRKPGAKAARPPKAPAARDAPSSAAASDSAGKRRTKTGCLTCRVRKLKCDEARPRCAQCARSRPARPCKYPSPGRSDDPDGAGGAEGVPAGSADDE